MLARPFLKQRPIVFKVGRLNFDSLPGYLNRQFYWDARRKPGFHCLQFIAIPAPLAHQIAVQRNVASVVSVATLAGIHGAMDFAIGIAAKDEAKLFSCPPAIRIEPNLTSGQCIGRDDD
jgi:hypothetical protein